MTDPNVAPRTVAFYADPSCPWAHLAAHRLAAARERLGLVDHVAIDVRAFPLELLNEVATPRPILEAEIPVAGALGPGAGWQMWQGASYDFPVTLLPAMEAVEAAKEQGMSASETLDRALRRAMFAESRNIAMRHEILAVARECPGVDADELRVALVAGTAREAIEEQFAQSRTDAVAGSPHLFTADGFSVHNPGITLHWEGEPGTGFPVVDADDPSVYDDVLSHALASAA